MEFKIINEALTNIFPSVEQMGFYGMLFELTKDDGSKEYKSLDECYIHFPDFNSLEELKEMGPGEYVMEIYPSEEEYKKHGIRCEYVFIIGSPYIEKQNADQPSVLAVSQCGTQGHYSQSGCSRVSSCCYGLGSMTCPACRDNESATTCISCPQSGLAACQYCGQSGSISCNACPRASYSACSGCGESGKTSCTTCSNDDVSASCSGCGNDGHNSCTSCRNSNIDCTSCPDYVFASCSGCGNSGLLDCDSCPRSIYSSCSGCGNSGIVSCDSCPRSTYSQCSGCGNSGQVSCIACPTSGLSSTNYDANLVFDDTKGSNNKVEIDNIDTVIIDGTSKSIGDLVAYSTNNGKSSSTAGLISETFDGSNGDTLSWDYICQAESADKGYVKIYKDNSLIKTFTYGGVSTASWKTETYTLTSSGSYSVRVEFTKNGSVNTLSDKFFFKKFYLTFSNGDKKYLSWGGSSIYSYDFNYFIKRV